MKKIVARWHIREIISVSLIAVLLGCIFTLSDWLYTFVYGLLSLVGIGPFVGEILFGLWCMGGSLAFMVVRLPGAALYGEIVGALVESAFGGQFGVVALVAGFFQGIGSELGFACYRYRRFDIRSLTLAAIFSTVITFASALFIHGYIKLHWSMLLALFITRLISNLVFSVGVVTVVQRLLVKAHVLKHSISQKEG